ncbi:MAG: hypothetical protein D6803_06675 [Anaerolineae bacterium]|nr:MAG: hypothetical protein D6803_06675 [Anaerolineae bacterium]
MPPQTDEQVRLLRQVLIFNECEDGELAQIAARLGVEQVQRGQIIFRQGDAPNRMYIIAEGKFDVLRREGRGEETLLARLEQGDAFGEEGLFARRPRSATIRAATNGQLYYLEAADFYWMVKHFPQVKPYLFAFRQTYETARQLQIRWLAKGETISLISRRHPLPMIKDMASTLGIEFLIVLLVVAVLSFAPDIRLLFNLSLIIGGGSFLLALGLCGWIYLEWRNDYLIVTNVRVVWRERILLRSASQQEVPLRAIQSLDVRTDNFIERMFKTGTLVVRTFNSEMYLTGVPQPEQMKNMLYGFMRRVRKIQQRARRQEMAQTLRDRLNMPRLDIPQELPENLPSVTQPKRYRLALFNTRIEEGNCVITYRKHWTVFFRKALFPTAGLFLLALTGILFAPALIKSSSFWILMGGMAVTGAGLLGWWLWQYVDWSNDIYRLTRDKVIDREKSPLGQETFRSAPLKNIQSVRHEIPNLIGLMFNVGAVYINVGDDTLVFHGVHDPATIHQDISRRMEELHIQQEKQRQAQERERVISWLEIYHEQVRDVFANRGEDHKPDIS